jgi:hypothetical protein
MYQWLPLLHTIFPLSPLSQSSIHLIGYVSWHSYSSTHAFFYCLDPDFLPSIDIWIPPLLCSSLQHFSSGLPHVSCAGQLLRCTSPLLRARAEHGCTCRLPGSLPAGILGDQIHTWTLKDFFPWITWICRSKTCRSQVPIGIPAVSSISGYL